MEMKTKTALISGGTRGIGKALCEHFCEKGYKVAFIYRSSDGAAKELAERTGAFAIKADVSSPNEVARAVSEAKNVLGNIDVLVNNAGISQIKLLSDITDGDLAAVMGTNFGGTFYLCREVSRDMIRRKHGRIINIGSMWGKCGASCETHYSASKSAVRGLTMALAKELGPSGITVNCIEPGVIATEMNASLDEATLRELCDETPLMRLGTPKDVSSLALFLASDEASFITGQCIGVDGGFAI